VRAPLVFLTFTLLITSCATPAASTRATSSSPATAQARPKTLTIAITASVTGYSPWDFSITGGGANSLAEMHTMGLISLDAQGNLVPRLAASLPSYDDGTIATLPDGRTRTTWKLRPGVTWHDGRAVAADDFVFSWEVLHEPEFLTASSRDILRAESVEAADASTLMITWKSTFYRALSLDNRRFWPFPRHIIGEAFLGDRQQFRGHPYFTTDYVNTGPYRLVDFGMGEQQVFERFDGYFLGQPKITTVILRTIDDVNSLIANLKAGTIDMASDKTLPGDLAVELRDEWRDSGEATILSRQDNWLYVYLQFDPQWASPPEIARDVRVRRGMLY